MRKPSPSAVVHRILGAVLGSVPAGLLFGIGVTMTVVASLAFASLDVSWIRDNSAPAQSVLFPRTFDQILLRNVSAALILYSGVVTLGFSSVTAGGILSLYVGATMALGVHSLGLRQLISDVIWYVPLEFGGLLLATTAGLQPLAGAVKLIAFNRGKLSLKSIQSDLAASLRTLALALALILMGSAIESFLIYFRAP